VCRLGAGAGCIEGEAQNYLTSWLADKSEHELRNVSFEGLGFCR